MAPRTCRVLIVDPFIDETEMYEEFLRLEGFEVETLGDAGLALETAVARPPDVLVARLRQMHPELDGVQVARALKTHDATRSVPVVIITTSIQLTDQEAAVAAGCESYLLLPCAPEELAAELRRVVTRTQLRRDRGGAKRSAKASLSPSEAPRDARKFLRH